ncbi:MAG: mandelate racemase/muconate lactonizing enzyme family protein, partial [Chloroflexota bacterium]|nr:mandelate racemase/muconate lactonizing enzyme family protein [Chloroflexota bacterium]
MMKITAVETVRLGAHANILFVRLHTDAGLIGLGDTWRMTDTVSAFVHRTAAPLLLGQDPFAIERHWR